jgi:uncharacterized membrane protein
MTKPRTIYAIMTVGSAVGLVASFLQTLEKLQLLKHTNGALVCDLNSVFSCTNVLNAWQSSVFGFPNSLMCIVFFTMVMATGLVGLSGGTLPRRLRLGVHFLAVFFLGFGLWFLWQSAFSGLLMVNWSWLRLNAGDLPLSKAARTKLKAGITKGADTFGWLILALLIAFLIALKFY